MRHSRSSSRPSRHLASLLVITASATAGFLACSSDSTSSPATNATDDAAASDGAGGGAEGGSATTDATSEASTPSAGVTVTSAGGTFDLGAGLKLTVPAGAVAIDTSVTLTMSATAPSGTGLAGATLLTDVLIAKPHGTTFAKPVTIEMPLRAGAPAATAPEVRFLSDESDTSWEKLTSATIVGSTLRFDTTHFSEHVGVDMAQIADGGPQDASVTDSAVTDAGTATPQCYQYAPLGSQAITPIAMAGGRLYFSPASGPGAGAVHSVAPDLTDYQKYPAQAGVSGIGDTSAGVFWFNKYPPADAGLTAGLYKLATSGGTPVYQDPLPVYSPVLMTGTATNLFYSTSNGQIVRADVQGQNPESFAGGSPDQLIVAGGYLYWVISTAAATNTWCATSGHTMPQIYRAPVNATAPATPEVVVDGCAIQAITTRFSEKLIRFAADGTNVYAQSDYGELWKVPAAGGTPTQMFQPSAPKANMGSAVVIVGSNLVFNDQDTAFGANPGMKKIPLAGGAPVRFALNYAGMSLASDSAYVYFANQEQVCRIAVP